MSETPEFFEARVRNLSSEGKAVVTHPDGRTFFVEAAWPGDLAHFRVLEFSGRYGFAEIIELKEGSTERREVPCAHQGVALGKCGGCPWMIGTYESQLKFKEHRLKHSLERAGLLEKPEILKAIRGAPSEWGYRNRAQFKTDGARFGFVSAGSREIADVEDCLTLSESMRTKLKTIRTSLPRKDWQPTPPHVWNFLDVDEWHLESDLELNKRLPFQQGNSKQNSVMKNWVAEQSDAVGVAGKNVIELFCGSGNLTEVLSEKGAGKILAVEVSGKALAALSARNLPGVATWGADLAHPHQMERLAEKLPAAQVLLMDPPREGAKGVDRLVKKLKRLESILSVSCDVATFVRDCVALKKAGFELESIQPLDLFPQTPHLEILAVLLRNH